jgi:hypothetical protein
MRRVERNLGCGARRVVGRAVVFAGGTDGITDMVEGLVGTVGGGRATRCAAKSARTLPLCDVSRPSMTCPFRVVLGAVVAVAQQVCHDRRGYLGDEVPQRGVPSTLMPRALSMVCVSRATGWQPCRRRCEGSAGCLDAR